MAIDKNHIEKIQRLVGDISESNLKYVDYYISDNLGIFIPSVGFCEYAITYQHTHPAYSFILFFSKEQSIIPVEIEMLNNHYLSTALSPDVPHEENKTDIFTRYIAIFISKDFYETQYLIYNKHLPEHYEWKQFLVEYDIMFYLKRFMLEYENKVQGNERILESLTIIITHQIIRNILKVGTPVNFVTDRLEIHRVIEYMHQHYGDKLTINKLANIANMSDSHFIRIFKKEINVAPMEYLIRLRIDKAKKLLKSKTKRITDISLQCGFNSTSHFSTCFIKHIGKTPSEFQNTYLE